MKLIKTIVLLFCFLFTTHALGKSNEYYQKTLVHVLTQCNSECQKQIFKQEVEYAMFALLDAILNQVRFELSKHTKVQL